jgi:hypothetical protein
VCHCPTGLVGTHDFENLLIALGTEQHLQQMHGFVALCGAQAAESQTRTPHVADRVVRPDRLAVLLADEAAARSHARCATRALTTTAGASRITASARPTTTAGGTSSLVWSENVKQPCLSGLISGIAAWSLTIGSILTSSFRPRTGNLGVRNYAVGRPNRVEPAVFACVRHSFRTGPRTRAPEF